MHVQVYIPCLILALTLPVTLQQNITRQSCIDSGCTENGTVRCEYDSRTNKTKCICYFGYRGVLCSDIDECTHNPCSSGICVNTIGSYRCICLPGTTGQHCKNLTSQRCPIGYEEDNINCTDAENNTSQRCHIEYEGDDTNCTDENNVTSQPCLIGNRTEDINCTDVDECTFSPFSPCRHGNCINTIGNYTCKCPSGWTGHTCSKDVNECTSSPCVYGHCINQPGSFFCDCFQNSSGTLCNVTKGHTKQSTQSSYVSGVTSIDEHTETTESSSQIYQTLTRPTQRIQNNSTTKITSMEQTSMSQTADTTFPQTKSASGMARIGQTFTNPTFKQTRLQTLSTSSVPSIGYTSNGQNSQTVYFQTESTQVISTEQTRVSPKGHTPYMQNESSQVVNMVHLLTSPAAHTTQLQMELVSQMTKSTRQTTSTDQTTNVNSSETTISMTEKETDISPTSEHTSINKSMLSVNQNPDESTNVGLVTGCVVGGVLAVGGGLAVSILLYRITRKRHIMIEPDKDTVTDVEQQVVTSSQEKQISS